MSIKNIAECDIKIKEKTGESNLLLNMPSNHILNGLNEDLITTTSTSGLLSTTPLGLPQTNHKSHSLKLIVLPYDYQEGGDKNCHRQSFYRAERRFK